MAIKRYYAKLDNTITDAFEENLVTRGTGSNMGAADILEVFSIYGQDSGSSGLSSELSRVLIKFNCTASTDSIKADRDAGTIPASGSVNFFLRLYNAKHGQTLPKSYTMDVSAISGSWNEGTGLDMELYKDKGASNWVNSLTNQVAATMTLTAAATLNGQNSTTITLTNADGTAVTFTTDNTKTETQSTATLIGTSGVSTLAKAVTSVHNALSAAITAGTLKMSISTLDVSSGNITLTQSVAGTAGNTTKPANITGITFAADFAGGSGAWSTTGGDYFTDAASSFTASFDDGTEDIELDITPLVEQWVNSAGNVLGSKEDEGVGVFLSNIYETATRSYYTKKFFARGTEFFFKKPCIEARWDSSIEDDRGNFYYSSSLATGEENLNTLYFYNYFRGRLRNIPDIGTGKIGVTIYSSSAGVPVPTSSVSLVADSTHVLSSNQFAVTGGYVSTGIYSASFAMTAAATPLTAINDVWFKLDNTVADASTGVQYGTGSVEPKIITNMYNAPTNDYVTAITNLRDFYRTDETARFRIYTRQKDWSPTIYTKAVNTPEVQVVESGSYEIYRVIDDLKVIPYGTGSTKHTFLSYDTSGSYFDLDMNMFETGYSYGIKLSFYNEDIGAYVEQPNNFIFKVE
mgnify:CR=1 FL=1